MTWRFRSVPIQLAPEFDNHAAGGVNEVLACDLARVEEHEIDLTSADEFGVPVYTAVVAFSVTCWLEWVLLGLLDPSAYLLTWISLAIALGVAITAFCRARTQGRHFKMYLRALADRDVDWEEITIVEEREWETFRSRLARSHLTEIASGSP
jgi:hypothetical protein